MVEIAYIYGLVSSASPDIVRYIGFSVNPEQRLSRHIYLSTKEKSKKNSWIQGELKKGNTIELQILMVVQREKAFEAEINMIKLFKSAGARLTNLTDGGQGSLNVSAETRAKKSEKMKGNKWNVGRQPSVKNRIALALGFKNMVRSKDSIERGKKARRETYLKRPSSFGAKYPLSKEVVIEILKNEGSLSNKQICEKYNIKKRNLYNLLYVSTICSEIKSSIGYKTKNQ